MVPPLWFFQAVCEVCIGFGPYLFGKQQQSQRDGRVPLWVGVSALHKQPLHFAPGIAGEQGKESATHIIDF